MEAGCQDGFPLTVYMCHHGVAFQFSHIVKEMITFIFLAMQLDVLSVLMADLNLTHANNVEFRNICIVPRRESS